MKYLAIKDWHRFQHFKDRRPPWIKLYRDLLDDREWFALDAHASKVLVMLWLIASEDDGKLPSIEDLSFRMRMSVKDLEKHMITLSHWLVQKDNSAISSEYRDDLPETETETETEKRQIYARNADSISLFDRWYAEYPRKVARPAALKAWGKHNFDSESVDDMIAILKKQKRRWTDPQFIPYPATYLNQCRWQDPPLKILGDTYNSEISDDAMPF